MMFTVTKAAAAQIQASAQASESQNMGLRIAAKQKPDGSLEYGMGFDHASDDDEVYQQHEVEIIIAPAFLPLLTGAKLDYVELEPGQFAFIFLNPNDANYSPPTE